MRAYGFFDKRMTANNKARKPDLRKQEELKEEEFQKSRRSNIKRAQGGADMRGQHMKVSDQQKKEKLEEYAKSADELLKDLSKIFEGRSLDLGKLNVNSRFGKTKNKLSRYQDQFGKRGQVNDNGEATDTDDIDDSEMADLKREILELLIETEAKEYKRNYLEEYLENKRRLERKRKVQDLLRELDTEMRNKK